MLPHEHFIHTSSSVGKSRREFGSGQITDFSFAQPRMKCLLETQRVQEVKKNLCAFRHPDSATVLSELVNVSLKLPGKSHRPAGWNWAMRKHQLSGVGKHG